MRRAIAVHHHAHWPEEATLDTVTLVYLNRHRRRIRLVADSGETFLLDLPRAHHLAEGDGLELDGGGYIRVCARLSRCSKSQPRIAPRCFALPGISATGICRYRLWVTAYAFARTTSLPRWSRVSTGA